MSDELVQPSDETRRQRFMEYFDADRRRLYAYVYAFMGDGAAADDVFQETSLVLWRDFDVFRPGTDFSKWANGIAFNRVRSYRRKAKRLGTTLSEETLEALAATAEAQPDETESRWQILQACKQQLRAIDQDLYQAFYVDNKKAQEIADKAGRSIFAVRKSIHKLRKKLFDCVDRKRRAEDA
jgi:RNA polymerase sigma-70 factor (ECF subfamily)